MRALVFVLAGLASALTSVSTSAQSDAEEVLAQTNIQNASALPGIHYSEEREPCDHFTETRQPLFGDLHVHSRYSFDSYISSQRNDAFDAYRFAKGEAVTLPDADGEQRIAAQLERPWDFASVTDHAEYLGQVSICTEDDAKAGYYWPHCGLTRSSVFWFQLIAANMWTKLGGL